MGAVFLPAHLCQNIIKRCDFRRLSGGLLLQRTLRKDYTGYDNRPRYSYPL